MFMDPFRKKFSVEDIPELSGKVIIVTGGATGIGKEVVEQLLRHNAKVYVASRSKGKFEQLLNHLKLKDPLMVAGLSFLELDLSDATSCISAAKRFTELEGRLDVLIANAALAVVNLIQHTSEAFGEARIVIVASHAHAMYKPVLPAKIDFEGLRTEGPKTIKSLADVQASLQRYARSKLANILFARRLHAHFQAAGYSNILVNCLNPGTVGAAPGTDSAALPPVFRLVNLSVVRLMSITPEDGALTTLLVATDPDIKSKSLSGRYFDVGPLAGKFYYGYTWDATDSKLSDLAKDEHLGEMLWNWSVEAEASIIAAASSC
ncbi:hypothetical protein GB937_004973 [Aspergillus fischeri]|nr:hypothetical protein GB937_004973 [Aspergillus fischeri]